MSVYAVPESALINYIRTNFEYGNYQIKQYKKLPVARLVIDANTKCKTLVYYNLMEDRVQEQII